MVEYICKLPASPNFPKQFLIFLLGGSINKILVAQYAF